MGLIDTCMPLSRNVARNSYIQLDKCTAWRYIEAHKV